MSSPGNSTINAKRRYFSTRKTHKTAQTCPEHTVVGQHQHLQDTAPQGVMLCLALPPETLLTQPGEREMQKTSFQQVYRKFYH